jgi:hypothetical protein
MSWFSQILGGNFNNPLGGFLGGLFGGVAQGAGGAIGAGIGGSLYGGKRVSSSDARHNEILLDRHQANQANRDTDTIHRMMPAEIWQHNTYQDATFGEDTRRMNERNQSLFYDKGVSPWELVGSQPASPLPTMGGQKSAGGAGGPAALASQIQAKTAERQQTLQASTALAQTKMQTDTQLKAAKIAADPNHEANQIKQFQALVDEYDKANQQSRRDSQTRIETRRLNLAFLQEAIKLLPEEHLNTAFIKSKSKKGYAQAIELLMSTATTGHLGSDPSKNLSKIPDQILEGLIDDLLGGSESLAGLASTAGTVAGGFGLLGLLKGKRRRTVSEKANPASPFNRARTRGNQHR